MENNYPNAQGLYDPCFEHDACGIGTIVNIDGEKVANKARVVCLSSFSSHIDNNDMLDYYSSINCEKIYLAHGDMDRKLAFKPMLEDAISKKNRTSRVVCANMDTKINL